MAPRSDAFADPRLRRRSTAMTTTMATTTRAAVNMGRSSALSGRGCRYSRGAVPSVSFSTCAIVRVGRPFAQVLSATTVPPIMTTVTATNVTGAIVVGTASIHRARQMGITRANAAAVDL